MDGTKIVVLQLKQIIKIAVFVVIGLVLLGILIYLFIPKGAAAPGGTGLYNPGTYSAAVDLNGSTATVNVTVTGDKIVSIKLSPLTADQQAFYPLLEPTMASLEKDIVSNQSLNITPSTQNTVTGEVLLSACADALGKSMNQ